MTANSIEQIRHLIGSRYVESVKAYIIELTGLATAAGPNDITTKDIRMDRVMISVDDQGCITDLAIG